MVYCTSGLIGFSEVTMMRCPLTRDLLQLVVWPLTPSWLNCSMEVPFFIIRVARKRISLGLIFIMQYNLTDIWNSISSRLLKKQRRVNIITLFLPTNKPKVSHSRSLEIYIGKEFNPQREYFQTGDMFKKR